MSGGGDDDSRKRAGFATDLAERLLLLGRVSVLLEVSAAMEEFAERLRVLAEEEGSRRRWFPS